MKLWNEFLRNTFEGALIAFVAIIALGVVRCTEANAQDASVGHKDFHDVYKEWMQPNSTQGCCNAKYHPETHEEVGGDCFPTNAWVINGTWYAYNDFTGDVIAIPDIKVIRERNPDRTGTRGHLCYSVGGARVLCFVPPVGIL